MSLAFSPFSIGRLRLANRIVLPPMQQYQGSAEGFATAYHAHHYARRARGGVGLVIVESTAVAPEGRLMADDVGLFSEAHVAPLAAVAAAVRQAAVPVLVQLCHGGRKAVPHRGGRLLAPSPLSYSDRYGLPEAMSPADIAAVTGAFATAARRALAAGFDGIELHAAHGYLLHQFLSPLSNHRSDAYGGDAPRRRRLLAEVITAVRAAVGPATPVTMRVSADDHAPGGLTPGQVALALRALVPLGLDAVHVSSGGLLPTLPQDAASGCRLRSAGVIRRATGAPVIAVGGIRTRRQVEEILRDGLADLVAIGRPLLIYPDLDRVL